MSRLSPRNNLFAFTLAEVLITLGVIGVVAALTLPGLIGNYKKQMYVTQLKKTVATLEQGFRKAMAEDGVDCLDDTELFRSIDEYYAPGMSYNENQDEFKSLFKKYFNVAKIDDGFSYYFESISGEPYDNADYGKIQLSDGSMIFHISLSQNAIKKTKQDCQLINALGGNMCSLQGEIAIDINGDKKGPNIVGRDIFYFDLSGDGYLYSWYSKDYALFHNQTDLSSNSKYWRNKLSECEQVGFSCAAIVMENGWVMDY